MYSWLSLFSYEEVFGNISLRIFQKSFSFKCFDMKIIGQAAVKNVKK